MPNEMPQKCRTKCHNVLGTDIVLFLIEFERLKGEG